MTEPFGERLAGLIDETARAMIEAKVEAQDRAVRARLPWPLRRASAVTVHRYPVLFRPWTRRWQIVEDLSTGEWRVERRPRRRDRAWRGV